MPALLDDPSAPDLLSLGTRCATCATADFLPWTCAGCDRAYCADHRSPAAHACPAPPTAEGAGRVVVPCPVCACGVELPAGVGLKDEDGVSAVVDAHMRGAACDPANYARVHAKPRCPAPGCRTSLTLVNAFDCRACGRRVCLKHRHGADHDCGGGGAARAVAGAAPGKRPGIAAAFRSVREALRRTGSGGGASVAAPPSAAAAAAAAAARRLTGGGGPAAPPPPTTTATTLSPRSAAAAAAHRRAAAASTTCPVCGLACATPKAVRTHHAAAHPGAAPLPQQCALS